MIRTTPRLARPWEGDYEVYEALERRFAEVEASYPLDTWMRLSDREQLALLFGKQHKRRIRPSYVPGDSPPRAPHAPRIMQHWRAEADEMAALQDKGFTPHEIGERFGLTAKQVRWRLHTRRRRIAREEQQQCAEPPK